jgi:hypothetical protein
VLINGRIARSSYKVRAGDAVEVELAEVVEAAVAPEDLPLSVVHEDAELAVIDKPPGMVVHPARDIARGTLANALAHRWGIAPGLVHRLDRDTSGVMVVARTDGAREQTIDRAVPQPRGEEVLRCARVRARARRAGRSPRPSRARSAEPPQDGHVRSGRGTRSAHAL